MISNILGKKQRVTVNRADSNPSASDPPGGSPEPAAGSRNGRRRSRERELRILEAALRLFGEKGFEATTVSAICEDAGVSEATLYEYFKSKEQVLFSIAELYTRREVDRLKELRHYIHDPREKLRATIQSYLEFYQRNPLYTSVALLTLKANRNFVQSPAYAVVREASRPIVEAFREGVEAGLFRPELDGSLVRNMVLGFIEHLTIQWIVVGRPDDISHYRDTIHEMVMRAIEKPRQTPEHVLRIDVRGAAADPVPDRPADPEDRGHPDRR
jgi:TetR/AcrR family fatty acid metabolism transcriptional regulator